jgi:DNA-binding LacI/PurR family transcriptional regulator
MDEKAPQQRISLRDIGRLANLSHSTVSLALRDNPSIALKTRQRVRELAASLGYVPDPMLRALAEYRRDKSVRRYQGSLGWISNHHDANDIVKHVELSLYWKGAEQRALELGYKMVRYTPVIEKMSSASLRRVLINSGIRGLLLTPQPETHAVWDFDFAGFSAMAFGFSLISPQLHVVTNCQFRSSILAVRRLRAGGFKRIGFVLSDRLNHASEGNFLGGFLAEQNKTPTRDRIAPFLSQGLNDKEKARFRQWFESHRPDVLLADFWEWTVGYLEDMGLSVPEGVPLAVLSANPNSRRFAGIDQNAFKIGQQAVDTVVGMIYRNETGVPETPTRILVEGRWQEGESVPILQNSPV